MNDPMTELQLRVDRLEIKTSNLLALLDKHEEEMQELHKQIKRLITLHEMQSTIDKLLQSRMDTLSHRLDLLQERIKHESR